MEEAAGELPFHVLVPESPPAGFALASAEIVTVAGAPSLTVYFQRDDGDVAGPLRLHEERAHRLPPASAARQYAVSVRGVVGRWTPGSHRLEWTEGGVYVSLDARGLDIRALLEVAASLTSFAAASQTTAPSPASPTSSAAATLVP
jgi:hypothetical protein